MAVKFAKSEPGHKKVTFSVDQEFTEGRVCSVVGDFNEWTPGKHKLVRRTAGKYSVSVVLPAGQYEYRVLRDQGEWLTDPEVASTGVNNVISIP